MCVDAAMSPKLADTPRSQRSIGFNYWKRQRADETLESVEKSGPLPKKLRMEPRTTSMIDLKDLTPGIM